MPRLFRIYSLLAKSTFATEPVILSILLSAFFWLLIAEVNPLKAFVSICILLLVPGLAAPIVRLLYVSSSSRELLTLIWLGPGVGVGLLILFVIRIVGSRGAFTVALIASGLFALIGIGKVRSKYVVEFSENSPDMRTDNWLWQVPASISAMGLMLRHDWWWTTPTSTGALITAIAWYPNQWPRLTRQLMKVLSVVLLLGAVAMSIRLRIDLWWISYSNDDDPWYHMIAKGLIEWGPRTNPAIDSRPEIENVAYHYLAYLLAGIVDSVWPSDAMFAVSRVLPVLTAVTVLCSLHLALQLLSTQRVQTASEVRRRFIAVGSFSLAVAVFFSGVPSNFLAAGLLIGSIGLAPRIISSVRFSRYLVLIIALTAAVSFSKATHLYAVTAVFTISAVLTPSRRHRMIFPLLTAAGLVLFFRQSSAGESIMLRFFSASSIGEHAAGGVAAKILSVFFVLAPLSLGFCAVLALWQFRCASPPLRAPTVSFLAVILGAAASRLFLEAHPRAHGYLFEPGLIASGLAVALLFVVSPPNRSSTVKFGIALAPIVALTWLFLVPKVVPDLNSGSTLAKALRMAREVSVLGLALLLGEVAKLVLSRFAIRPMQLHNSNRVRLNGHLLILSLFVATAVPPASTLFIERLNETTAGEETLWRVNVLGSEAARDISKRLNELNSEDDLVAYMLCGDDLKRGCEPPFVFGAFSGSRFLHLGGFSEDWGFRTDEEYEDFQLSTALASMPVVAAVKALQSRGVAYLIVDLQRANGNWVDNSAIAPIAYVNDRFALIDLHSRKSE